MDTQGRPEDSLSKTHLFHHNWAVRKTPSCLCSHVTQDWSWGGLWATAKPAQGSNRGGYFRLHPGDVSAALVRQRSCSGFSGSWTQDPADGGRISQL